MSVRIYHTSDLHARGGIAARLRALRAEEPGWLFDSGDALRGSQSIYRKREPILAEMEAAGYDAQGMGNREFHYLYGALCARAAQIRRPLVCSNLGDVRGRALPFVSELALECDDAGTTRRLRLFSLLVVQYPAGSPWERAFGWRFRDPIDVAREFAATTPPGTLLAVLSHLGLRVDRKLAAAVPRLDLILGGHSHDTLFAPEYVGDVPIVHAGPYGAHVSRTELDLSGERARISRFDLLPLRSAA